MGYKLFKEEIVMSKLPIQKPQTPEHKLGHVTHENFTETVDFNTGEVMQTLRGTSKVQDKEPDYIKVYLNTMMAFQGVEGISAEFMLSLSRYVEGYINSETTPLIFRNDVYNKSKIAKEVGVTTSMVAKNIQKLSNAGVLIKSNMRSIYYVNPWLIARGKWSNIKKLQLHFDIVDGTWQVDTTLNPEPQTEEEDDASA